MTFARAGHELPLFAAQGPADRRLPSRTSSRSEGMPLGLVPGRPVRVGHRGQDRALRPGDTLVLYTDGITEAPNEEEKEFSSARLADAVRALPRQRPRARSTTAILESVRRFSGAALQRDDLTLVTVKRT